MQTLMNLASRVGDKSGSLGAVVAAMGCSFCFPAMASLGAAIGLGFLAQYEGFLLTKVLPGAAILTLAVNLLGYWYHRQWLRTLLGITGPIVILLILNFWFATHWRNDAIYSALGLMAAVSIWDIFWPANRHCAVPGESLSPDSDRPRTES